MDCRRCKTHMLSSINLCPMKAPMCAYIQVYPLTSTHFSLRGFFASKKDFFSMNRLLGGSVINNCLKTIWLFCFCIRIVQPKAIFFRQGNFHLVPTIPDEIFHTTGIGCGISLATQFCDIPFNASKNGKSAINEGDEASFVRPLVLDSGPLLS